MGWSSSTTIPSELATRIRELSSLRKALTLMMRLSRARATRSARSNTGSLRSIPTWLHGTSTA